MAKTLFLIRHAHRDKKLGSDFDNGISEKGQKQAKRIKNWFEEHYADIDPLVVSSPKLRCLETIKPLADHYGKKIEIEKLIGEGFGLEARVKEFYKWWMKEAPEYVIACSHGDVLPLLLFEMTGGRTDFSKGCIAVVHGPTTAPTLYGLIQDP